MGARMMCPSRRAKTLPQEMERMMSLVPWEGVQLGRVERCGMSVVAFKVVVEGVYTLPFSEPDIDAESIW
jgi:hypothetical protein